MKKNLKKITLILLAAVLLAGGIIYAASNAASSDDPLVSSGYLDGEYSTEFKDNVESSLSSMDSYVNSALSGVGIKHADWKYTSGFEKLFLKSSDTLTFELGTSVVLISGSAELNISSGSVINISSGVEVGSGNMIKNARYFAVEDSLAVVRISSDTAVISVDGGYLLTSSSATDYYALADALHSMNLFKGSDNGYELERPATRTEGLIMLIRLLGEEKEALACTDSHPFKDVKSWAAPYVAYAYKKGYTNGISSTLFGSNNEITANQYMTFVLRAMGYTEGNSGYSWDKSLSYARASNFLSAAELNKLESSSFLRAQVVYLSYHALSQSVYGSNSTLLSKLVEKGVFASSVASSAMGNISNADIK